LFHLSSVVITGIYNREERDTGLFLRGSRNQKIILNNKNLVDYYSKEQRQVEIEIGDDYIKYLGFPEDFINQ